MYLKIFCFSHSEKESQIWGSQKLNNGTHGWEWDFESFDW